MSFVCVASLPLPRLSLLFSFADRRLRARPAAIFQGGRSVRRHAEGTKSTFSQPFKEECISEVVLSSLIWVSYEKPSSPYCAMLYLWWGCRRNLKLVTLGSERVNVGHTVKTARAVWPRQLNCIVCQHLSIVARDIARNAARVGTSFTSATLQGTITSRSTPLSAVLWIEIGNPEPLFSCGQRKWPIVACLHTPLKINCMLFCAQSCIVEPRVVLFPRHSYLRFVVFVLFCFCVCVFLTWCSRIFRSLTTRSGVEWLTSCEFQKTWAPLMLGA